MKKIQKYNKNISHDVKNFFKIRPKYDKQIMLVCTTIQ